MVDISRYIPLFIGLQFHYYHKNSTIFFCAPRGRVVPAGRAWKSYRRVTTARKGTVQKRVGRVRMHPLDPGSLRYWWRLLDK